MGITIVDPACGRTAYVIHDIKSLYEGIEFVVTYGSERGSWTDEAFFEAGDMVEVH